MTNININEVKVLLQNILQKEQDKLEPCVVNEIKIFLNRLNYIDKSETNKKSVLNFLGKILDKLPQIIALIESFWR